MTTTAVALVTGANKGLGKEVVRQLARLGVTVLLGSRNVARGEEAARELLAEGLPVSCVELDVTNEASASLVAERIRREHGRLDILVNNAGIYMARPALEVNGEGDASNFRHKRLWRGHHDPQHGAAVERRTCRTYREHCEHNSVPSADFRSQNHVRPREQHPPLRVIEIRGNNVDPAICQRHAS